MVESGSSVPRRQLGRHLRQAREEAGMTLEAAAQELEWSRAKMYRIEGGQTLMRKHDVLAMCTVYAATRELTEALVALSVESKSKGWWHAYGDVIPAWFELYVGLEAAASRLRFFQLALIPGLLQTPEYAAAIFRTMPGTTEPEVTQAVALRMERQRLLTRRRPKAPTLEVILDQAVLYRQVPDQEAMRAQLAHLVNNAQATGVRVRILPPDAGALAANAGSFAILDFPPLGRQQVDPPTVYIEELTGALYLDKPAELATYADRWDRLSARALSADESDDLIATVIKESYE
ncbi:helix-turn-helix domain-containing protein [Plantactinospora solaniradicis]|uniref:Helix-turn-helix domain-containing protein n=1 Tax=Plantactinospora solaniradicis TaxID=1723736 RepID=A0ABW1KCM5_9ACTN